MDEYTRINGSTKEDILYSTSRVSGKEGVSFTRTLRGKWKIGGQQRRREF